MIRIANGQGFWGDSLEAPLQLLRQVPIDYLTLDYLAEVTMSILQKQRARDPRAGYARDFVGVIDQGAKEIVERRIKVIANAGGVNPEACRDAVATALRGANVKIAVVTGDEITSRLDEFIDRGVDFTNLDTGRALTTILTRVQSANVYFGAFPIAEALSQGAQIVITGRCADAALALAPMIHEFGWRANDWDLLAAGIVAGHAIECGAQCTGGNCQAAWDTIPDFAGIGYPIVEAESDGRMVVTKHAGTGGRVDVAGITEQLLYEIGDPRAYITPDVIADFTTIQLDQDGPNRVRFSGVRGRPATDHYKVSISYSAGFKAAGALIYGWPDAAKKARASACILRERLDRLGIAFDAFHSEVLGGESPDVPQVVLRVAVRAYDKAPIERFTKELAPLALNGPPVVAGLGAGRPKVEEIVAYWPALIPKSMVCPHVH